MTDPSTSAQTPGSAEVEAEVKAQRAESARRRSGALGRILRVLIPLAVMTTCADMSWGNFVVFSLRARQAEANGFLRCLASLPAAEAPTWTGELDAAELMTREGAPCAVPHTKRYLFWRTPRGVSPVVFGARVAPQFTREIGDDFWMAPGGGAPINCFNAVQPSYFIVPERSPLLDDPRCAATLALVGRSVSELQPRR